MNQELADIIALQAITYLLSDEKRISWLLGETGISIGDLQNAPDRPEVFAGILDFLLSQESMLIEFSETNELDPTSVVKAREFFPGSSQGLEWT